MRRISTPLLVTGLSLFAAFTALGSWQLDRIEEKKQRLQEFDAELAPVSLDAALRDPDVQQYTRVEGEGSYDSDHQFLIDNIPRDGIAGYYVLTPLVLTQGGPQVLVNRGWVPADPRRESLPDISVDGSLRHVRGRLDGLPVPGIRMHEPRGTSWPRVIAFAEWPKLQEALGVDLARRTVLLDRDVGQGYRRDFEPVGMRPERHLAYAVQWFGLAVAVLVVWTWLALREEGDTDDG